MKLLDILESTESNLHVAQMMTQGLRYLKIDLKDVEVKTQAYKHSLQKQCFNNSYRYLIDHFSDNNKYVLGYVFYKGIPIEHAWVNIHDQNLDVTLDVDKQDGYISAIEISMETLLAFVDKNEFAPSIYDLNKFMHKNKEH